MSPQGLTTHPRQRRRCADPLQKKQASVGRPVPHLPLVFCSGDESHQRDARHSHHCEDRRDAETDHWVRNRREKGRVPAITLVTVRVLRPLGEPQVETKDETDECFCIVPGLDPVSLLLSFSCEKSFERFLGWFGVDPRAAPKVLRFRSNWKNWADLRTEPSDCMRENAY